MGGGLGGGVCADYHTVTIPALLKASMHSFIRRLHLTNCHELVQEHSILACIGHMIVSYSRMFLRNIMFSHGQQLYTKYNLSMHQRRFTP